jgi:putative ABC transport system permease protein
MFSMLEIIISSFKMALLELAKNKLRTFLSLFGVTIGIFCIIGVLATVKSLERNIKTAIETLGTNTVYIDKWEWGTSGTPDYPYWKYAKRPTPSYTELEEIKKRTTAAKNVAFMVQSSMAVEVGDNMLNNIVVYGITPEYVSIQPLEIAAGRMITDNEFQNGVNTAIIGDEVAVELFGEPDRAPGKQISIKGRRITVGGVIKKQGAQTLGGGWQFDKSVVIPYKYSRTLMDEKRLNPLIMVKGQDHITIEVLKDELTGVMRSVRKLSPAEENDFALNGVTDFSDRMKPAFTSINIGGWAIGAMAFIVGIFGVANIMFVTVKERTPQIGLKKAIGAKNNVILAEFLLESAFLCIIGGIIGLILVYILTVIITKFANFPVFLSADIIGLAIFICIVAGMVAGIIPAIRASKMDPVVAIRSH